MTIRKRFWPYLAALGPGLLAASAGNDAGGIATYASAGASYGYGLLWALVLVSIFVGVVQEMSARALLVDTEALTRAQEDGDVLLANEIFMDAFYTDVRRDLAGWREERGLPADPMRAYLASGYQEQIEADRIGGTQAGWS